MNENSLCEFTNPHCGFVPGPMNVCDGTGFPHSGIFGVESPYTPQSVYRASRRAPQMARICVQTLSLRSGGLRFTETIRIPPIARNRHEPQIARDDVFTMHSTAYQEESRKNAHFSTYNSDKRASTCVIYGLFSSCRTRVFSNGGTFSATSAFQLSL
jgi:hypothetical protein